LKELRSLIQCLTLLVVLLIGLCDYLLYSALHVSRSLASLPFGSIKYGKVTQGYSAQKLSG
jgi:hypothetical protein